MIQLINYSESPEFRKRMDLLAENCFIPASMREPTRQITMMRPDTSHRDPPEEKPWNELVQKVAEFNGDIVYDENVDAIFVLTMFGVVLVCAQLFADLGFKYYADTTKRKILPVKPYDLDLTRSGIKGFTSDENGEKK